MPTILELKTFLKLNNVRGYSGKNKDELLQMVDDYKNSEPLIPEQKSDFLSRLPSNLTSQIGTYLSYKDTIKTSNLQTNLTSGILSKYRTCATIEIPEKIIQSKGYDFYVNQIYENLQYLLQASPNLQFLNFELIVGSRSKNDIYSEILNLLKFIAQFKGLQGLQFHIKYNKNEYLIMNIDMALLIDSMNLKYLQIHLIIEDINILNTILGIPNLIYLDLPIDYGKLSNVSDDKITQSNVETLYITSYADLRPFKNLRRLKSTYLYSSLLENFKYTPNLEVLETDIFYLPSFNKIYLSKLDFSKNLKYLKIGFPDDVSSQDKFFGVLLSLLSTMPKLEYLIINNGKDIDIPTFIKILEVLKNYKIKYMQLGSVNMNIENIYKYWIEIKKIVKAIPTQIYLSKIYLYNNYIKLDELWELTQSQNNLFYTPKNNYTPEQWLQDHKYFSPPQCV